MTILPKPHHFRSGLVIAALGLITNPATASLLVTPISGDPDSLKIVGVDGPTSLDSGLITVPNGTVSAKAFGDNRTGTTRVATSLNLNGALSNEIFYTQANSDVFGRTTLTGPGVAPVEIKISFEFDGFFTPSSLVAQYYIGTLTTIANEAQYSSSLSFQADGFTPGISTTLLGTRSFDPGTGELTTVDDAMAAPLVLSASQAATHGALAGEVRATAAIVPGETFSILFGTTAITELSALYPSGYAAGYGGVDGYDTGKMNIFLPEGYSLSGTNGFLSSAHIVMIPEPKIWAFMLAGLAVLAAVSRQRPRRRWACLASA